MDCPSGSVISESGRFRDRGHVMKYEMSENMSGKMRENARRSIVIDKGYNKTVFFFDFQQKIVI